MMTQFLKGSKDFLMRLLSTFYYYCSLTYYFRIQYAQCDLSNVAIANGETCTTFHCIAIPVYLRKTDVATGF